MTRRKSRSPVTQTARSGELARLVSAVRAAGALALTFFGKDPRTDIKPDGTAVSEADLAADALLRELLAGDGGYGWLSEESDDNPARLNMASVWIVDPIDGTRAFLKCKPEWTISAALAENGRPVLAAVFNPATDEFFHAELGKGAFLNGNRLAVPDPVDISGSRLAASSSQLHREKWGIDWPFIETVWVNSIAYRLALVAAGACDGAVSLSGKSDWDLAAAHLIVEEAGGVMTTHSGEPFRYNRASVRHPSVVAAGPVLHEALIARTSRAKL